jgi:uncharacterized protein (DUF1800 family)
LAAALAAGLWQSLTLAGPVPRPGTALQPATDARFVSEQTIIALDSARPLRVIPVRVAAASDSDRAAEATSDDPGVLTVERGVRLLPGQVMGYLIVRPVAPGRTTLHVGSSSINVRVTPGASGVASADKAFGPTPELLTPVSGAGVWGTIHVGAAYWLIPGETDVPAAPVKLRVGDGPNARFVEPVWTSTPDDGPLILCSFAVDFGDRAPGPCPMRVVRTDAAGAVYSSDPALVQVVAPKPEAITAGECETDYGLLPPNVVGPPKPPAFSTDATASGGRFFNNANTDPRFRFPLDVPSDLGAGWYQVVLTAGGDPAAGALPSVGVNIDEAQRPTTAGAIAQPGWHRIAIGTPVRLEPGRHVIRCDFVNDFSARSLERTSSDRNLRLDRVEIARVADDAGPESAHSQDAMNAGGAMAAPPAPAPGGESMMAMNAMGGSAGASLSGGWPASARAGTRPPVRIAFERPIDNLPIAGEVEIRGTVWWENQQKSPPPEVALLLNGREVQRQRSDAPRFIVPPENFRPGENTVQLRAMSGFGFAANTAPQRLILPAELGLSAATDHPRVSRRFTIYDPVWTPRFGKTLNEYQGGEGRKSGPIAASSQIALELPDELAGTFDVWVEARSNGRAAHRVELMLQTGPEQDPALPARPVATREVPNWFDAHRITTDDARALDLSRGPKRLLLCVPAANGGWAPRKGDANAVWIQAVRLVERTSLTAVASPHVVLDYPAESQSVFGSDALVATVTDANALDWAEPVIDSQPSGLRFDVRHTLNGVGRLLVPLPLRALAPGEHHVALRVGDMRGRIAESVVRTIRVLDTAPVEPTIYDRTVMLLDRFAYGPDPRELADALRLGHANYLESRLDAGDGIDRSENAAQDLAAVKLTNPRSGYDVPRRAIQQAIATGNPVRNRFTLWAENHFSTWVRKDEAWRKLDEHERFSALGVARFYDLLAASATSPAMLRYLDQERSYGGRLNENYAREIMELHTLGVHGGYTQQDVTNLAHVLTGWTTARIALASVPEATPDEDGLADDFRFEPTLNENLSEFRDVVGYRFAPVAKPDRHRRVLLALEILAAHPSTARFVCTKLANHYVGVPETAANPALIDDLASVFTRSGGDMKQVLLALGEHPVFWQAARSKRLAHPNDYAFRLARTAGWMNPQEIGAFLDSSGQGLFERPTPDGFPELDTEAMDSNAILQRWKLAGKADSAFADALPPVIRWSSEPLTPELRQTIIDLLAIRLTGRPLGESSNTQALLVLQQSQPDRSAKPDDLARDLQIRTVATFIAQLPEANVR